MTGALDIMPSRMLALVATMMDEDEDENAMLMALETMHLALDPRVLVAHAHALVALLEHRYTSVRDEVASGLLPHVLSTMSAHAQLKHARQIASYLDVCYDHEVRDAAEGALLELPKWLQNDEEVQTMAKRCVDHEVFTLH